MAAEILETQPEDETLDQLPEDSEAQNGRVPRSAGDSAALSMRM